MKRLALTAAVLLAACSASRADWIKANGVQTEQLDLEVTPAAPPTPAMKYQLLFENLADRRPGNAAITYLQATLLVGTDTPAKVDKALDAYEAKDFKAFDASVESINAQSLMQVLNVAARRETADWQPPFRETGVRTLLPHLSPMRDISNYIKVRALHQVHQGQTDDAIATLRIGYTMSDAVGHEPVLVAALVSVGMFANLNDPVADLIRRPDSPNLYWAMADLPRRLPTFRSCFEGGRLGSATSTVPALARALAGQELTADEWRATLTEVSAIIKATDGKAPPDPFKNTSPDVLNAAREWYAKSRHIPAEQAEKVDPAAVLGPYYFDRYVFAYDEMYKLRPLPYPALLRMATEYVKNVEAWRKEQPANPFLHGLPALDRAMATFARIDRSLAALTAVEAIRAYAASHGGSLPQRLVDVTETPVPNNPYTDRPFEYRVDGGVATLADSQSESHLAYTIRLRK